MTSLAEVLFVYTLFDRSRYRWKVGKVHVLRMDDESIIFANLENDYGIKPYGEFLKITPDGRIILRYDMSNFVNSVINQELNELTEIFAPRVNACTYGIHYNKERIYIHRLAYPIGESYDNTGRAYYYSHTLSLPKSGIVEINLRGDLIAGKTVLKAEKDVSDVTPSKKRKKTW